MSRWIDAEWLMNFFVDIPNNFTLTIGNLRATVNDAPSIDIVRCKECRRLTDETDEEDGYSWLWCQYWLREVNPDDFCSYGEREGE